MGGFPFGRRPKVLLASSLFGRETWVVRREAPVLLPAEVGFPFGRRPKVLLAVGELFVWARSARSQARSACVIVRRRRVFIRPKAEGFARRRRALCSGASRALCSGAKRLCYCPPK